MVARVGPTLSRRDLTHLRNTVVGIQDEEIQGYLLEALTCVEHDANHAALVLAWSAVSHCLRRTVHDVVEHLGMGVLQQATQRVGWSSKRATKLDRGNWNRRLWSDSEFLSVCREMGILGATEEKDLSQFCELRNRCAHPTRREVVQGQPITLLQFLLQRASTTISYGWCLPSTFFARFVVQPPVAPDQQRVQSLLDVLCKEQQLPLARVLLNLYWDPYAPVESVEKEQAQVDSKGQGNTQVKPKEQENVQVEPPQVVRAAAYEMWKALAARLDSERRTTVNRLVAQSLRQVGMSTLPELRGLVFWDQWERTDDDVRRVITTHLIPEFHMLVDAGHISLEDLHRLETMAAFSEGDSVHECQDVLTQARHVARSTVVIDKEVAP